MVRKELDSNSAEYCVDLVEPDDFLRFGILVNTLRTQ
jgi:hypothetical protein